MPKDFGKEFNYEITEKIAVLSKYGDTSKELNKVSYNGYPAKYDLRSWKRSSEGEKMMKGITLSRDEAGELKKALNARSDI